MSDAVAVSAILARHVYSAIVSDETRAVTKRAVMDAIGVMTAASGLGEGCDAFAALAQESGESGPCTILGFGLRSSPIMAAFANGAMARASAGRSTLRREGPGNGTTGADSRQSPVRVVLLPV